MTKTKSTYGNDTPPDCPEVAFIRRFDAWIIRQSEFIRLNAALAFGEEYEQMRAKFEVEEP